MKQNVARRQKETRDYYSSLNIVPRPQKQKKPIPEVFQRMWDEEKHMSAKLKLISRQL